MSTFSLHTIAPRLARARDQFLAHQRAEAVYDLQYRTRRLELERLVAHRELEALRSDYIHTSRKKRIRHVSERWRKLTQARAALERLEHHHAQHRKQAA